MLPSTFVKQLTGLSDDALFNNRANPMVAFESDGTKVSISKWAVPDVVQPTDADFQAALAAPDPALGLLAYASAKQNEILCQVWTFNLGTASAPLALTTKLDDAGQNAMLKVYLWGLMNASVSGALEPYSNVDFSPVSLTPSQAMSFGQKAGAVVSQTYGALNSIAAGVSASPATITTTAQIDAAAWPTSG